MDPIEKFILAINLFIISLISFVSGLFSIFFLYDWFDTGKFDLTGFGTCLLIFLISSYIVGVIQNKTDLENLLDYMPISHWIEIIIIGLTNFNLVYHGVNYLYFRYKGNKIGFREYLRQQFREGE